MSHVSMARTSLTQLVFFQNESTNAAVIATRKTLNPHCFYLNSTFSFHQVFTKDHLDHLKLAGVTLRANCNAGTNFSTNKCWHQDLFHLWLVRNGIANLLSLPQLDGDGFTVSYQTVGTWIVTTPHSKEIIFHREAYGVCCGFPDTSLRAPRPSWPWFIPSAALQGFYQAQSP